MSSELVVITGASRGIGEAVTYRLARPGRRLVLYARSGADLERVCDRARDLGAEVGHRIVDMSRPGEVASALDEIEGGLGPVARLVLNAGVSSQRRFLDADLASIEYEMRVNFFAPMLFLRRILNQMIRDDRGRIAVVGSLTSVVPFPGNASYAASKTALQALVRSVRLEISDTNVHLGLILPGFTATAMTAGLESVLPSMTADEVARAVEQCLERRRSLVVPGVLNKLAMRIFSAMPGTADAVLARLPSPLPKAPSREPEATGEGLRRRLRLWPRVS